MNGQEYADMTAFMNCFRLIIYLSELYTVCAAIQLLPTVSGSPADASPLPLALYLSSPVPRPQPPIRSKSNKIDIRPYYRAMGILSIFRVSVK